VDADAVEIRVLGCLVEKQRTTPDQYPLSLNALRLACNQATNRDPAGSLVRRYRGAPNSPGGAAVAFGAWMPILSRSACSAA